MKKNLYKYFIILGLLFVVSAKADNKADSLYKLLSKKTHDTTRINIYNELCWPVYAYSNTDSSLKYGNLAVELSKKNRDTLRLIVAYRRLGIAFTNIADHKKALECQQKSFDLAKAIGNRKAMASALNNLSVIYLNISDFKKAIDYSIQSQKTQEELKDSTNLFNAYYNTGLLFKSINDLVSAKRYYYKAFALADKKKNLNEKAFAVGGLANILKKENKFDSAYYFFFKAEQWFKKENHLQGLEEVYVNLGSLYSDDKRMKDNSNLYKGLEYYYMALKINSQYSNKLTKGNIMGNIAVVYNNLHNIDSTIIYAHKAIDLAKESDDNAEIVFSSKLLSDAYFEKGNFSQSIKYLKLHVLMKDSVYNYEKQKEIGQKQMRYEFEKKSIADSLKVSEDKKITQEKLKQEATIRYSLFFFILLLVVFSFIMFNRFKIIKKQKQIIETQKSKVDEKQKEIVDSINYAKRIQSTILDNQVVMKEFFSDHFIYFKPKDIVSGDFYWAHRKDNKYYIAVCDCTGHGVPGAFMSLLSIGYLNEAIENNILKPNEIFNYVRERLILSISQEEQKDGFDGILICIDAITKEITYAAANNKPVLISNNQIIEQNLDKMPVGKGEKTEPFMLHRLNAKTGDTLFLYTDGYADQFGGSKGKKFKYRPLNELLQNNTNLPMNEQLDVLSKQFELWKGDLEQVDDICIMGIKL